MLLTLLFVVAGGAAVVLAVWLFNRRRKDRHQGLPTDPLADYFVHDDESV